MQAGVAADLDRRLSQVDDDVDKSSRRGSANAANTLADQQRKNRAALAASRTVGAGNLAELRVPKAALEAKLATYDPRATRASLDGFTKYLSEKAVSYRTVAFDFCKAKRG